MTHQKFPRGSEWRKWDLHFHTPASFDYQDKSLTAENIVDLLVAHEVAAVAITDHHVMDVAFIRRMQQFGKDKITIFPGIELRSQLGGSEYVHYIGIFPENSDLDHLWTTLQGKCEMTPQGIAARGGDSGFYVEIEKACPIIKDLGGVVTIHAGKKSNGIEELSNADAVKRTVKKELATRYIHALEIGQPKDADPYRKIVFPHIEKSLPLLLCSDNHNAKKYTLKSPMWIKADPTFQGLKQIFNEPEDRVFIGEIPPSLARITQHPTRIATSVEIKKSATATITENWFDISVLLNSELIAVIGNKGSGKSAFSDVLGLLGNTPKHEAFSFLTPEKFRSPKNNKARQFCASLTWADGTEDTASSLDEDPYANAVEKVKYIPQSYLENICNEIGSGKEGQFYNELQQVIFSHIHEAERLGFETLDELLAHRSEETTQAIGQFVAKLKECNVQIATSEERALPQHRKALESQLAEKKRELDAHAATRPAEIQKPEADPASQQQSKAATEELEKRQSELSALELEIATLHADDLTAAKKCSTIEKLIGKLKNLERHIDAFRVESKPDFDELGIPVSEAVTFNIDSSKIDALLKRQVAERVVIAEKLSPEIDESPKSKQKSTIAAINGLRAKLSAPQQAYQSYLQTLKEWETGKSKIIGTDNSPGTIKYLEKQLGDLDGLPAHLKMLRKNRNRMALEIFREKRKLRTYYQTYYGEIQNFLKTHPLATSERFQLTFNVSMAESGFSEGFLGRLNRRRVGPFMGDEEGTAEMKKLLDNANFDSARGTLRFINSLFAKMTERDGKSLLVKDQLRQGGTVQDIYDFAFSLGFLSPIYNLQWDGKRLEQLSPGERGNLLLIFYLLVDRGDIPLVIDQPEENLDNQTVYKTLVPCIKDAKKRRQIIMVTHNPNLAVVCDAEQVICAEMRKDQENTVTYISGSIEDPVINARIVDILEGTRPAFDKRDDKYLP